VRSYGALDALDVPSYIAVDARVGWKPSRRVELSLLVRNLTDPAHIEWSPGAELDRGWFLNVRTTF
jgi:iron complex outermembrane receptor protein